MARMSDSEKTIWHWKARAEAAEERASQLEHERDEWQARCRNASQRWGQTERELEQARREADQLRAVLEKIVAAYSDDGEEFLAQADNKIAAPAHGATPKAAEPHFRGANGPRGAFPEGDDGEPGAAVAKEQT